MESLEIYMDDPSHEKLSITIKGILYMKFWILQKEKLIGLLICFTWDEPMPNKTYVIDGTRH